MEVFKRYDNQKKLEFIRWDWKWMGFGIFLGKGNYLKGRGIEFFTNIYRTCPRILCPFLGWHIGWTKPYCGKRKIFRWDWSGSMKEPWWSWTLRIWRFGIGTRTPKWIQNWKRRQNEKFWEKVEAEMIAIDPSFGEDPDEEQTDYYSIY